MAKILAFVWFVASLLTVNAPFPAENVGGYMHVFIVYIFGFLSGGFLADEYNSKE